METLEIGRQLVALCHDGKHEEAIETFYSDGIVSIEGASNGEIPARLEGIEAVRGKTQWWFENHEIHEQRIEGPFVAEGSDQFLVYFYFDVTSKGQERMQMAEVGIYTVLDGKIVQEQFFFPPMG